MPKTSSGASGGPSMVGVWEYANWAREWSDPTVHFGGMQSWRRKCECMCRRGPEEERASEGSEAPKGVDSER